MGRFTLPRSPKPLALRLYECHRITTTAVPPRDPQVGPHDPDSPAPCDVVGADEADVGPVRPGVPSVRRPHAPVRGDRAPRDQPPHPLASRPSIPRTTTRHAMAKTAGRRTRTPHRWVQRHRPAGLCRLIKLHPCSTSSPTATRAKVWARGRRRRRPRAPAKGAKGAKLTPAKRREHYPGTDATDDGDSGGDGAPNVIDTVGCLVSWRAAVLRSLQERNPRLRGPLPALR